MGLFKAGKITACYSHFSGCARVYPYAQSL